MNCSVLQYIWEVVYEVFKSWIIVQPMKLIKFGSESRSDYWQMSSRE